MTAPTASALRRLRWWDVEALVPLERELFGAQGWSAEVFWSELAAPDRCYLVAEGPVAEGPVAEGPVAEGPVAEGGPAVLGYAGLAGGVGSEADIQTLAVAPAARGRGTGRALLGALLAEADRRGASAVLLEVRADNAPATALYASAGFERVAVRHRYYQPGDVDAVVMRRRSA